MASRRILYIKGKVTEIICKKIKIFILYSITSFLKIMSLLR